MRWISKTPNVTLSDVATRAGVSRMTVSKVLRGTGSISRPTQERILAAVDELGYVKNTLAGQLSSKKSSIIGVVIPSVSEIVFAEMLSGINSVIRPHGLSTLIAESMFNSEIEYETISSLLSMQPAGLIISGGLEQADNTVALLEKRRCPLVSVWDTDVSIGDNTIGVSHYAAGEMMAAHFLQRGCCNPGYVGSQLQLDICAQHRFDGFTRYMSKHGHHVESMTSKTLPRQTDSGGELTEQLLSAHPSVSAIFYLNDAMAIGGLRWLTQNGYEVPAQVAVAGFNGTSISQTIQTRLTTLNVPREKIGCQAAMSIMKLLEGLTPCNDHGIELDLVQGTTT